MLIPEAVLTGSQDIALTNFSIEITWKRRSRDGKSNSEPGAYQYPALSWFPYQHLNSKQDGPRYHVIRDSRVPNLRDQLQGRESKSMRPNMGTLEKINIENASNSARANLNCSSFGSYQW